MLTCAVSWINCIINLLHGVWKTLISLYVFSDIGQEITRFEPNGMKYCPTWCALKLFTNKILIRSCRSQIIEISHIPYLWKFLTLITIIFPYLTENLLSLFSANPFPHNLYNIFIHSFIHFVVCLATWSTAFS
jgi:hypothetical protein